MYNFASGVNFGGQNFCENFLCGSGEKKADKYGTHKNFVPYDKYQIALFVGGPPNFEGINILSKSFTLQTVNE